MAMKTGLVTAKDHKRPVSHGSVQFFEVSRFGRTSYGYGLRYWAPKDWTGLDFQTLLLCGGHLLQNYIPSLIFIYSRSSQNA